MKRVASILGAAVLAAMTATAASANGTTLADLAAGGSIVVGDKTFDNFSIFSLPQNNVNAGNISVTGLTSDSMLGLSFNLGQEISAADGGYTDFCFGYRVSVNDPSMVINGASFNVTGASLARSDDLMDPLTGGTKDVFSSVQSTCNLGGGDLASLYTQFVFGEGSQMSDSGTFGGQSWVYVVDDLAAYALNGGNAALLSFTQLFSQAPKEVPEPGTLALLGLGLAGLGLVRRRR